MEVMTNDELVAFHAVEAYSILGWFMENGDKLDDDAETSHINEDDCYMHVLRAIAGGYGNPKKLVSDVLVIADMDFSRWHA